RVINMGAFYLAPSDPALLTRLAENAVAKTALAAATRVMADELAPHITVNCVAPGPVGADHPMRELTAHFPVPPPADPDELADLVAFLCSRQAGHLTGLAIPFDGGSTRRIP
ncbi:MAG: SDR family oxidoreductase, partial [Bacillota bacterium]